MSIEAMLEKQVEKNTKIIKELAIQIENINRQTDELLKELNVSPEQLTAFLGSKESFSEENWNALNSQRKALEEKLLRELANVKNPSKTKQAFKERNVQPHWLFVR